MQRSVKLLLTGVLIVAAIAAWFVFRPGSETVVMDLVAELPNASRRPMPEIFSVVDATLGEETRRAILVKAVGEPLSGSRLIWEVTVPDNAWLGFSVGLLPEAWTIEGDGVLFRVGVSDKTNYEELLSYNPNPFANPTDRQWHHLTVDLSPYAGQRVEVIFNTNASPPTAPGTPGRNDGTGDLAVWGAPRIFVR